MNRGGEGRERGSTNSTSSWVLTAGTRASSTFLYMLGEEEPSLVYFECS